MKEDNMGSTWDRMKGIMLQSATEVRQGFLVWMKKIAYRNALEWSWNMLYNMDIDENIVAKISGHWTKNFDANKMFLEKMKETKPRTCNRVNEDKKTLMK